MAEIGSPEWQMEYYRQQMNQLQSQTGGIGMQNIAAYDHLRNLYDQARNQVMLSNQQASSQAQNDAAAEAERRRQQILDQTLGAKQSMLDDPALAAAQQFYQNTLSGQGVPYNEQIQNLMRSQASIGLNAGEASARRSLQEQLGMTGGSMADPSYQAAVRGYETDRMRGMQDINTQIALQAAQANYAAQQQAAGGLSAARMDQLNSANQLGLVGAQYLNTPIQDNSNNGGFSGTISYGGLGLSSQPSQQRPSTLPQNNSYIQQAQSQAPQQSTQQAPQQAGGAANFIWPTAPEQIPNQVMNGTMYNFPSSVPTTWGVDNF